MSSYIARRILSTVPVVLFVMLFVFSLLYLAPGDPAAILAGDQATREDIENIRTELGLDRSFPVRFAEWATGIFQGDFGTSIFTREPVSKMILARIEPTVSLMVVTLTIALVIAIPMGVAAAWSRGSLLDRVIMLLAVLGFSVPVFVVGYVLAWFLALKFGWLPVQGYSPIGDGLWPWLRSLLLPAATLSGVYIALIARITRATMLEILQQDYIRTARAKGAAGHTVLFIHALRNDLDWVQTQHYKAPTYPAFLALASGVSRLCESQTLASCEFALRNSCHAHPTRKARSADRAL